MTRTAAEHVSQFHRTGDGGQLDQAIALMRRTLELAEHSPVIDPAWPAGNLANLLLHRFETSRRREDLDESLRLLRKIATETGATPTQSGDLVRIMRHRYELDRDSDELDQSIRLARFCLARIAREDPDYAGIQHQLGLLLDHRFDHSSHIRDLDAAIEAHRTAAALSGSDRARLLVNLAGSLRAKYDFTGDATCLAEGIQAATQAAGAFAASDPLHGEMYWQAGVLLRYRYEATGDLAYLAESVELLRRAVNHAGHDEQILANRRNSLAAALARQFQHSGDVEVLTEAIEVLRWTAGRPAPAAERAARLNNLAVALRERFLHFRDLGALREAISVLEEAIAGTSPGDQRRTEYVSTLGIAQQNLFERTGDPEAAERAVTAAREVVRATAGNTPTRWLETLANALYLRSRARGEVEDHQEALQLLEEVLVQTPFGTPGHAGCLSNLSNMWLSEFHRGGQDTALDRAIAYMGRAVRSDPVPAAMRAGYYRQHGKLLLLQHDRTADPGALRAAGRAFARATDEASGPLSIVLAASEWSATAARLDDWPQAKRAAELAMTLIPQVTSRRLARADREHGLVQLAGVAADAAACALQLGDPQLALRWLEQGRGVLMSQALESGGDLGRLREQHPTLAQQLAEATDTIDSDEEDSDERHARAALREDILAEIRTLPGFGEFLQPPSLTELHACAAVGPVVLINLSRHRCDALIVRRDDLITVALTKLTLDDADRQARRFQAALAAACVPGPSELDGHRMVTEILQWLWDTVTGPILDQLRPSPHQRLWWSPGGPLSSLPLHAAGHHGRRESEPLTVLDRVTSSYTPTVRALGHARAAISTGPLPNGRLLVVSMPETGRERPLPYARKEAAALAALWPTDELTGPTATRDEVLAALPSHAYVHFACHGVSDGDNPSASRLVMHDERPLTLLDVSRLRLPAARLAVLSACHTAHGTPALADEALHIAGAFQLAGYPEVIGTLWSINDRIASRIAIGFHTKLIEDASRVVPDPQRSAAALHAVIREFRDGGYPPIVWAAYIHTGA
ncbi:CHAT domain-containing protein [Nocardia sp. CA-129566]|uniref:CHAT domain-containing protein n=1 Tax=Nocardia sp. CA-129566 TaxID=3239976 RepID=UPI003D96B242